MSNEGKDMIIGELNAELDRLRAANSRLSDQVLSYAKKEQDLQIDKEDAKRMATYTEIIDTVYKHCRTIDPDNEIFAFHYVLKDPVDFAEQMISIINPLDYVQCDGCENPQEDCCCKL